MAGRLKTIVGICLFPPPNTIWGRYLVCIYASFNSFRLARSSGGHTMYTQYKLSKFANLCFGVRFVPRPLIRQRQPAVTWDTKWKGDPRLASPSLIGSDPVTGRGGSCVRIQNQGQPTNGLISYFLSNCRDQSTTKEKSKKMEEEEIGWFWPKCLLWANQPIAYFQPHLIRIDSPPPRRYIWPLYFQ